MNDLKQKFHTGFRWNVFGSIVFEAIKILHHVFLLKVLNPVEFGLLANLYSITYLTVYFSDIAATTTLPPFLNVFIKSKQNFKKLFSFYIFPQLPLLSIAAAIVTFLYSKSIFNHPSSPIMAIIPLLIVCEGMRIFFRAFLHYLFLHKLVIILENSLTCGYYAMLWFLYLFLGFKMTLNLIFIPFLLDSIAAIIIFIILSIRVYKKLPEESSNIPPGFYLRIIKNRMFNYPNQIVKNFFTGNFLTPIFAMQFGLQQAGVLKFSSMIADSVKAVIKAAINFSGNAFLAQIKTKSLDTKREVFQLLTTKLNNLMYFMIIFLLFNFKNLLGLRVSLDYVAQTSISFSFIFLMIILAEHFFLVYEQFYVLEEKPHKFLIFKLLELFVFYLFVLSKPLTSPITTLLSVLFIQILSFTILSIHAHYQWRIKPTFKIKFINLFYYLFVALIFYLIFKH